jgi:hypothetical protein
MGSGEAPGSPQGRGTHPPGHKGVGFLQCGGVQLKERSNVIAMGHSHQAVLDLLPSIPATSTALGPLGYQPQVRRESFLPLR